MMVMSKAMMKFTKSTQYYTDNVGDMMDTLLYFGILWTDTEDYPVRKPNIPKLIEQKKLNISYTQEDDHKVFNFKLR